jgi:hypothetical protein
MCCRETHTHTHRFLVLPLPLFHETHRSGVTSSHAAATSAFLSTLFLPFLCVITHILSLIVVIILLFIPLPSPLVLRTSILFPGHLPPPP